MSCFVYFTCCVVLCYVHCLCRGALGYFYEGWRGKICGFLSGREIVSNKRKVTKWGQGDKGKGGFPLECCLLSNAKQKSTQSGDMRYFEL